MADNEQTPEFGANSWLVDEMYRQYLADPGSVAESWQEFFSDYTPSWESGGARGVATPPAQAAPAQSAPSRPAAKAPAAQATATTPAPAKAAPAKAATKPAAEPAASSNGHAPEGAAQIRGVAATIAQNMQESLTVPTATSIRVVPAKLLEVNRTILNNQLRRTRGGKLSFTHLIGWAIVRAMSDMRVMTSSYHEVDGKPHVFRPDHFNLGLAVDVEKKDGSRTLLVPNIKLADTLDFAGFFRAYEDVIRKIKANELTPELFADTTATLTNPGTVGTVGSVPRLMPGQSVIVGVGAIDYPAEYQAADPRTLAEIGVGKVITITSTYDHRVIQGAESGLFLQRIHELLLGKHDFYDEIFSSLKIPYEPVRWRADDHSRIAAGAVDNRYDKQVAVQQIINMYRVRGHLIANLNPLQHTFQRVHSELDPATYGLTIWDLDREFATGGLAGRDRMALKEILGLLRDAYCRTIGVEYMHMQEPEQKNWLQDQIEGVSYSFSSEEQRRILEKLNAAEAFEKFLHTKYIGHKRFSLEGAESLIPMLDSILNQAADNGVEEVVMGMAHRGRLNVLTNVMGKDYNKIFREFEGDLDPESVQGSGDVKYHLGQHAKHTSPGGNTIAVALSSNPSHLEAVDPVVEGMVRAKIDQMPGATAGPGAPVLPVLVHGDAAFAGQGVVGETLAMSQLRGYRTGGTVHVVVNNQVGFTTSPMSARSSTYATDVAKMVQAPIFHVNGDDPEACVRVMQLAFEFRQAFGKDVVVDLICYRRWGHNEGDDPSYTQPLMYKAIEARRSVRKLYTEELVNRGDLTLEAAEQALDDFRSRLENALKQTRESSPPDAGVVDLGVVPTGEVAPRVETGVDRETLDRVALAVTSWPDGFDPHPKLAKQLEKRRLMLEQDNADWAMGEALAFGSMLLEGSPIRLSGQDSRRGTFSQRHSVLIDYETAAEHTPLAQLAPDQAPFMTYDSLLSEFAAMGFEYGYSVARPDALVLWEAQFGDFVNGAQVIIDQFLVAAEDKWGQRSGLVLLLPHGYEGQGPEHSSARIERFLTLCAEGNMQVAQPTTAAQYFHLLRRQMARELRKPLIVFTPKALLRAKPAASAASEFTSGSFQEVFPVASDVPAGDVRRVLLCSGKVAYDLDAAREERQAPAAILRVEQLYPFPEEQIREAIATYPNAQDVYWVQDEPENMGPWPFVHGRLHSVVGKQLPLRHASRAESASPATGSHAMHEQEQRKLMEDAFNGL